MRVLVTGARLPAALEIARALSSRGIEVYTADTVHFGFAVRSRSVKRYFQIPSPVFERLKFREAMLEITRDQGIDLVVPVSEEVFFLSAFASEMPCPLFAPPFETLRRLHSKLKFQDLLPCPPTRLVTNRPELEDAVREFGDVVVKQEYSRGAIGTFIRPASFEALRYPTLVQKFLEGPEICTYSIAQAGKLLAHAAYEPRYRYGHGASVYFRSVQDDSILKIVENVVTSLNYTGQIAFDFIQTVNGPLALECNPRATSGVHLLSPGQIADAIVGTARELNVAPAGVSRSAKLTLLATNFVSPRDFFSAKDTSFSLRDPYPFLSQFASGLELFQRARKWKMKPGDAFGYDLEWNGEPFE